MQLAKRFTCKATGERGLFDKKSILQVGGTVFYFDTKRVEETAKGEGITGNACWKNCAVRD